MKNFTYPIGLPSTYFNNNSEYINQTLLMSIGHYPKDISYAHNTVPIVYNLRRIPSYNANYKLTLTVNGLVPIGHSIVFKNINSTVTIKSAINPRGNQFKTFGPPTPSSMVRYNEIAQSIILTLRNNATFNSQYTINTGNALNTVVIEARNSGVIYAFDSNTLITSLTNSNIMYQIDNNNVSEYSWQLIYTDAKLFTELYVASGSYGDVINKLNSELADTLDFKLYANDSVSVGVNQSLRLYVGSVLPKNPYTTSFTLEALDYKSDLPIVRPYYFSYGVRHRSSSLDSYEQYTNGISKILYISNSGTKDALMDYDYNRYILDLNSGLAFDYLTDYPIDLNATEGKIVSRNAIEYLHFYKKSTSSPYANLSIEIEYILNDNASYFASQSISNYDTLKGVLSVEVSPHTMNLNTIELTTGLTVKDYIVRFFWFNNGIKRYSNAFKYTLKADCNENSINLLFLNRLGVFEAIEFQNLRSIGLDRSTDVITKPLNINGALYGFESKAEAVKRNFNTVTSELLSLISIPYPTSHLDWALQLSSTSEIYIWYPSENTYKAVLIEDFAINQTINTELFTIEMTVSKSITNTTI